MSEGWRTRAPRSVTGPYDSQGSPVFTPTDRRWLWRLEGFLPSFGATAEQRQMHADLREYLHETCEHHWIRYTAEPGEDPIRQCHWCKRPEWLINGKWLAGPPGEPAAA